MNTTCPPPVPGLVNCRTAWSRSCGSGSFHAEAGCLAHRRVAGPNGHVVPQVIEELKKQARPRACGTCYFPAEFVRLTQLEYAPIAELSGWSLDVAPETMNCAAPDTGNVELLHLLGSDQQKREWLEPLLAGEIRSAFAMTEPDVASSDATNIATRIERDGHEYAIDGRKWWTSGAMDPRCAFFILMGKTDPSAPAYRQQTMVLVPRDTPGVTVVRDYPVLGHHDQPATPRSPSPASACLSRTSSARKAAASRPPRPGSAPAGFTTACGPSARPSAPWRCWFSGPRSEWPSAARWPTRT